MLKNILLVEDPETASPFVRKTLTDAGVLHADYVDRFDEALERIKNGNKAEHYDLLITDLYFAADNHAQSIKGGSELITAARQVRPDLKVIVFSAEKKAAVIEKLFNELNIDGYVRKSLNDTHELRLALESIARKRRHFPADLRQMIRQKNTYEFTEFDILIVLLLSQGMRQKDIPHYLRENQIKPSGLSSVEKRLSRMKEALELSKNEQLVAFCKDMGII